MNGLWRARERRRKRCRADFWMLNHYRFLAALEEIDKVIMAQAKKNAELWDRVIRKGVIKVASKKKKGKRKGC